MAYKFVIMEHQPILDRFKSLGQMGHLHHAQLWVGPEHVGKTHLALVLASFLQGGEDNPILKKQIFEGLHSDTILFLESTELSIEAIRRVVERAHQSHASPYLIFILENIGRMKAEAANALLKTLEEPHPKTLFFLTANQEEDVLPTLQSRCHETRFQTVQEAQLREFCSEHVYSDELVFFAMGRPGKLRRLLDDSAYFEAHRVIFEDLNRFLDSPSVAQALDLSRCYTSHPLLLEMLDILLQRARTWALSASQPSFLNVVELASILEQIEDTKYKLRNHVNAQLTLDHLLLSFTH